MASKQPESIVANPNWTTAQRTFFHRLREALPVMMGYLGSEIPVLDNHTLEAVIDETGVLKQVKKVAETAEKAHVERLKTRLNDKDARGGTYAATWSGGSRVILKQDACKEFINKADAIDVHLGRLLAAIESGQVQLPNNVFLKEATEGEFASEVDPVPPETNHTDFFTTAAGGRSLYVKPIE